MEGYQVATVAKRANSYVATVAKTANSFVATVAKTVEEVRVTIPAFVDSRAVSVLRSWRVCHYPQFSQQRRSRAVTSFPRRREPRHCGLSRWVPACAGMTVCFSLGTRLRGYDGLFLAGYPPARV